MAPWWGRALFVVGTVVGCSSDSESHGKGGGGGNVVLAEGICVDPANACCCAAEGLFDEVLPACTIHMQGDPSTVTFELLRESEATLLRRVSSAAECGAEGGWYVARMEGMTTIIELCEATCSIRHGETTKLRPLSGCPATAC